MEKREEKFRAYVEILKKKFPNTTIVLIGSRAENKALPYSDYDLVVIFKEINNKFSLIEEIRKYKPKGFSLDLIVLSLEDLKDPVIAKMLKKKVIFHDGLNLIYKL